MREIKIDKRNFNKLFFDMWNDDIKQLKEGVHKRYIISYGGASAGKSFSLAQRWVLKCLKKKVKLLVIRETKASLKESCIDLFVQILRSWEIEYKINQTDGKITFENESVIIFKGCIPDIDRLKSVNGVSDIWIEEASQIFEADYNQIITRLRGRQAEFGEVVISFNPVSELHWIKKRFFSEDFKTDNIRIYHSTYRDNKFITQQDIDTIESFRTVDETHYMIYGLGAWGVIRTGSETYRWSIKNNQKLLEEMDYKHNPHLPLYISVDENVKPYCMVVVFQILNEKLVVIDELALDGKNIEEVCMEFKRRYLHIHEGQLIITGDATSRKRDMKLQKGANFFTLIAGYLEEFNPSTRVMNINENVYLRILFANILFSQNKIVIKKNCNTTTIDLQSVKWGSDGASKNKSNVTRKLGDGSKETFQEFGHATDCLDYAILLIYQKEFYQFKNKTKAHTAITAMRPSAGY